MPDKVSGSPGADELRREVEEKVDELELRVTAVERHLAERARVALDRDELRRVNPVDPVVPDDSDGPASSKT